MSAFIVGQRVQLSDDGVAQFPRLHNVSGIVARLQSKRLLVATTSGEYFSNPDMIYVQWDTRTKPMRLHRDFIKAAESQDNL